MLKSYLKTAFRSLRRERGYAAINVVGLAVGMACALLIFLFVRDQLQYDRFHEKADRIVRVTITRGMPEPLTSANTALPTGPALEADFPEVLDAVRARRRSGPVLRYADRQFVENDIFAVDSTFLEVFDFELLYGDPATALDQPEAIVPTETAARRYFGSDNPIGRTLTYQTSSGSIDLTVTGVLRDVPSQSHLQFDFLVPFATFGGEFADDWQIFVMNYTYLLLPNGLDVAQLEAKLPPFIDRHVELDEDALYSLALQPLTDIHLHSGLVNEAGQNGNAAYVYLFSAVALFILLIACVNFVNLTTARSARRAREVGLRKVIGATRRQLIIQFLGESLLMGLFALVLGVLLVRALLPAFGDITGRSLSAGIDGELLLALVGIVAFVGIAAGAYPALYLSSFQPSTVLRGMYARTAASGRKALVVFQFATSIGLLICTTVVFQQMRYVQSKDLGFDEKQIVVLPIDPAVGRQSETIKSALLQHASVTSVTASMLVPSTDVWTYGIRIPRTGERMTFGTYMVDHDFVDTYGMEMAAGRWFTESFGTDSSAAVINEQAVQRLGFTSPEDAIGMEIAWATQKDVTVIGVVEDFHATSLRDAIEHIIFLLEPDYYYLSARVATNEVASIVAFLESTMTAFAPERPFEYFFVDERFDALHRSDRQIGQIFGGFALLATLIACLGLFGLASYTAEGRQKEVGVRKVLGASVGSIVALLSSEFTRLVLVALVIAAPIAYLAMSRWLEGFAYRVDISPVLILAAGGTALAIAFLTVSYQAVSAALTDPIRSLRSE